MKVYKSTWFVRFARKEKITSNMLLSALNQAEQGLIEADLGGGVIKQRIARPGEGKSGGYRSIILYRQADKAFFVFGFAKNSRENIREDELEQFKKMARHVLSLTSAQIQELLNLGHFEEVDND